MLHEMFSAPYSCLEPSHNTRDVTLTEFFNGVYESLFSERMAHYELIVNNKTWVENFIQIHVFLHMQSN